MHRITSTLTRFLALVVLGIGLAGWIVPIHSAQAATSPRALALSSSDVTHAFGSHWRTVFSRTVSNAEIRSLSSVPGLGGASPVVRDRITGYLSGFSRNGAVAFKAGKIVATPGVASVISYANIYRSAGGPRAALNGAARFKMKKTAGLTYHIAPLGGIGDGAVVESVTFKTSQQLPISHAAVVLFRRGRYLGMVSVAWYSSKPNTSDAVHLASIMDGRFRAAG